MMVANFRLSCSPSFWNGGALFPNQVTRAREQCGRESKGSKLHWSSSLDGNKLGHCSNIMPYRRRPFRGMNSLIPKSQASFRFPLFFLCQNSKVRRTC